MSRSHQSAFCISAREGTSRIDRQSLVCKLRRRAVELTHRKDVASVDTLAEALYANREFRNAVAVEAKALRLEPDNAELQKHMARYCEAAGMIRSPQNLGKYGSPQTNPEAHAEETSTNRASHDRVPLLWIVPAASAIVAATPR